MERINPSFVAPSHVVLLEDFDNEFKIEYNRHEELAKIRQDKTRFHYFPDTLFEDLWRIIDSFCWFATDDIVTASIPISKLARGMSSSGTTMQLDKTKADYFLGYEDGSNVEIGFDLMNIRVSGHYPLHLPTFPCCVIIYDVVDATKRILIQLLSNDARDLAFFELNYYFIWTKQYSQTLKTREEVDATIILLRNIGIGVDVVVHVTNTWVTWLDVRDHLPKILRSISTQNL